MRLALVAVAAMAVAAAGAPGAWAVDPPDVDAIPLRSSPPDPSPAPAVPMKQKYSTCRTSATLKNSVWAQQPPANVAFEVEQLHQFSTGEGVTVAIIDSGVSPNVRLPHLKGGGDYIANGSGLDDCDHHGTLVAGIIGAGPSSRDKFIGVAPDAKLISIRQTSDMYEPSNSQDRDKATPTLLTLARAIVHAANMGATVINMSVTACYPAGDLVDTSELASALRYAVEKKDVVIVAAAGNTSDSACKPNAPFDPTNPGDRRNWGGVQTISTPSFYTPLVLSVGGATLTGQPYTGTMTGPWVAVAGPATDIVSLDPATRSGTLTNAVITQDSGGEGTTTRTIAGTSFAAAYVSGLAALIRSANPDLSAKQVRQRIVATAATVAATDQGALGNGIVQPMAALTWTDAEQRADGPLSRPLPQRIRPPDYSWVPKAVAGTVVALSALIAATIIGVGTGRRTQRSGARRRH